MYEFRFSYALARWGLTGATLWLGTVTWWKSAITWRRREHGGVIAKGSLIPRLHLPNVWEVESGNEASQVTYSDDVIAHHQSMV